MIIENSLVVQWLGLGTFTDWAPGSSMVRELKSSKSQGILRRKKKKKGSMKNKYKLKID